MNAMHPTIAKLALAASLLATPSMSAAQVPPAERTPDAALSARADSLTVGEYCHFAQRLLADATVLTVLGPDSSDARASAAVICNPLLSSFSLLALTGRSPAPLKAVARIEVNTYSEAQLGILDAMTQFRADLRQPSMMPVVRASLGADNGRFILLTETAHGLVVILARDRALTRLANYERKLGPTSARLNGLEVLLNYSAQRWVPGFKPSPLHGPSPLEVVASYAPGYVTFDDDPTPIVVSVAEFGMRHYLFGDRFGKPGMMGILLPTYFAGGLLVASDESGALVWPWRGENHYGGYLSWGAIKVGYVNREGGRWLVSKQFQAIPLVF